LNKVNDMVNVRVSILILIIFIIVLVIFSFNTISNQEVTNTKSNNSTMLANQNTNNSTSKISKVNLGIMDGHSIDDNLILPTKDYILKNINWSNYPIINNPYIHNYEVSDPTDVISHKFLYVVIVVEVKDIKNKTEVFNELSGVVSEERKILGPNSGPTVWGTVDGVWVYYAVILPYENEICVRYLP
jgi:hypothetical protein